MPGSSGEIQPRALYPTPVNSEVFTSVRKRVDFVIGFRLSPSTNTDLEHGTYATSNAIAIINQTNCFTRLVPMFVNPEVKCHHPKDDPKVQLAVRITGAFKKRAEERYGRNMRVLAVAVYGDDWWPWIVYKPCLQRESPVETIVRLFYILHLGLNMLTFSIKIPRTVRGGKQYEYARHLPHFAPSSSHGRLGPNGVLQVVQGVRS
jgi:hypothetical protein